MNFHWSKRFSSRSLVIVRTGPKCGSFGPKLNEVRVFKSNVGCVVSMVTCSCRAKSMTRVMSVSRTCTEPHRWIISQIEPYHKNLQLQYHVMSIKSASFFLLANLTYWIAPTLNLCSTKRIEGFLHFIRAKYHSQFHIQCYSISKLLDTITLNNQSIVATLFIIIHIICVAITKWNLQRMSCIVIVIVIHEDRSNDQDTSTYSHFKSRTMGF